MNLFKTRHYIKNTGVLPEKIQSLLLNQEKLLEKDIFHSKLHTKKLKGFPDDKIFSFRITSVYRGIFRLNSEGIILFAIGHRKEIYPKIIL